MKAQRVVRESVARRDSRSREGVDGESIALRCVHS